MRYLRHLIAAWGLLNSGSNQARAHPLAAARSEALAPVLNVDFPDPSILQDSDGKWYAFATNGNGKQVQAASAPAPQGPWTLLDTDVMPDPGPWTTGKNTWAPDVRKIADGRYVLFYSGESTAGTPGQHCVGTATSGFVLGPYTASSQPLSCPLDQGGAIDPAGYFDEATGTRWVVYKIDGNNKGNGGDCNNGVAPIHSTPIMLQQMSADDWVTPVGSATQILDRTDADGPLVEAPSLARAPDGTYVLLYSSHCYSSAEYDVKYATSASIAGPYERGAAPLIGTGDLGGLASPGGATSAPGADRLVFHANCPAGRCMFYSGLSASKDKVLLST